MADDQPLLPTLRDPRLDQALRGSLEVLRDRATDDEVRARIEAVLRGDLSLRSLARDGAFGAFVSPLVERGARELDELPADTRREYDEQAARDFPD